MWGRLPCILALLAAATQAHAQECNGRTIAAKKPDLSDVKVHYPLFLETTRKRYLLEGNCARLSGREFRGILTLLVRNKFPDALANQAAVIRVKSLRTFSVVATPKIKVSRGGAWQMRNGQAWDSAPRLNDIPVPVAPASWNEAHANHHEPEGANDKIAVPWHAYAHDDRSLNSLSPGGFWNIPNASIGENQTLTNYIIQFPTSTNGSPIKFHVFTPQVITRVDLEMESNIDSLLTKYTFLLGD